MHAASAISHVKCLTQEIPSVASTNHVLKPTSAGFVGESMR
jgi:hypothetical protein